MLLTESRQSAEQDNFRRGVWVPAFAGTTTGQSSERKLRLNQLRNSLDQPAKLARRQQEHDVIRTQETSQSLQGIIRLIDRLGIEVGGAGPGDDLILGELRVRGSTLRGRLE